MLPNARPKTLINLNKSNLVQKLKKIRFNLLHFPNGHSWSTSFLFPVGFHLSSTVFPFITADVNECASAIHNCSHFAVCNNTKGSFNCTCKQGYSGDGFNCTGKEGRTVSLFVTLRTKSPVTGKCSKVFVVVVLFFSISFFFFFLHNSQDLSALQQLYWRKRALC